MSAFDKENSHHVQYVIFLDLTDINVLENMFVPFFSFWFPCSNLRPATQFCGNHGAASGCKKIETFCFDLERILIISYFKLFYIVKCI